MFERDGLMGGASAGWGLGRGSGRLLLSMRFRYGMRVLAAVCVLSGAGASLRAMEHVTLRNGFELDCERREVVGERVRLYLMPGAAGIAAVANYVEVAADAVVRVESLPDPVQPRYAVEKQILRYAKDDNKKDGGKDVPAKVGEGWGVPARGGESSIMLAPTAGEMREMLAHAGVEHRVDADLLASVVRAESGGQVRAVSRTGARGLMQLMPGTATELGVTDAFVPRQNIDGGSAYLDHMLTRYHDDMALALAAYNAGPAAVDRYHGVPPYRETRAYVARVIREFNRRKLAER